jgi:hypothetical protein
MNAPFPTTSPASSAAVRVRRYRERRRKGLHCVSILLRVTDVEELIRWGYLPPNERDNSEALQKAASDLLQVALGTWRDA